jgi:biotin operon repressor
MTTFAATNFKELQKYESFASVEEMDNSIYKYIDHINQYVPQSVIDVLLCLGRASLRCVGLSFMKQATIAKMTGYSRKTINKALKKLESLGVVDSVRTKTKSGRPSVKVMRILPFCLDRLHAGVTSMEADEASNDAGLTLVDEFEPFKNNHLKQERDNKQAVRGNIEKVLSFFKMKLEDRVKDGDKIEHLSSYAERVLRHEERKLLIKQQRQQQQQRKQRQNVHTTPKVDFNLFANMLGFE